MIQRWAALHSRRMSTLSASHENPPYEGGEDGDSKTPAEQTAGRRGTETLVAHAAARRLRRDKRRWCRRLGRWFRID